jgi:hypothetical protein
MGDSGMILHCWYLDDIGLVIFEWCKMVAIWLCTWTISFDDVNCYISKWCKIVDIAIMLLYMEDSWVMLHGSYLMMLDVGYLDEVR